MSVHEYRYIENRKWEDTAKEVSQLESQGWELVSIAHGGQGTGLKPHQAWMRIAKSPPGTRPTPPIGIDFEPVLAAASE